MQADPLNIVNGSTEIAILVSLRVSLDRTVILVDEVREISANDLI